MTLQERLRSMAVVSEGLAAELVDFLRQAADALDAAERRIKELEAELARLKVEVELAEGELRRRARRAGGRRQARW